MACHGGFSLDEKTRRGWFNPEKILQDAGLTTGMVFVDVGCGDGFFTMLAAQFVGKTGRVYAVDADAAAIERLKQRSSERGFVNVKAVVAEAEETVFCDECADVVFYSIVLHDFHDAAKVLQNARRMVKASGKVVDLDWKKQRMAFGPPEHIRFSEEKASELLEAAGFKIQSVADVGPHHYIVTAKP
jgi:FkbM family methyltransferase